MSAIRPDGGQRQRRPLLAGLTATFIVVSSLSVALFSIVATGLQNAEEGATAVTPQLPGGWIINRLPKQYQLPHLERLRNGGQPSIRRSRAAASSAQAQAQAQAQPFPGGPRHRTGGTGTGRPGNYTIARPSECRHEAVYVDCFLCGKVTEEGRIYRACCQREPEIVSFCTRLLS